ncbi:DoxX family membrane protein [Flavobacteriaceae bacterium M23B6Z8]
MNSKEIGYLVVRVLVSLILIIHGLKNVLTLDGFKTYVIENLHKIEFFTPDWLSYLLISIPFIEILFGVLLLAGFLTKAILKTSHYTFIGIAVFLMIVNEMDSAFLYVVLSTILFFLMIKIHYNVWSLDKRFHSFFS